LAATFCLFFVPHVVQAKKNYYYIHVGSFRAKSNAVRVAEDLQKKGYSAVVRGEEVTGIAFTLAPSLHIKRLKHEVTS